MSIAKTKPSLLLFVLLSAVAIMPNTYAWQSAEQWIKVTAAKNIRYEYEIVDLQSSIIKSSDDSQIIKLNATPFSANGKIIFNVNLSYCTLTSLHQVTIPLESTPNNTLYTPAKNYPLVVDANCYGSTDSRSMVINITVNGNPFDGYHINIQ